MLHSHHHPVPSGHLLPSTQLTRRSLAPHSSYATRQSNLAPLPVSVKEYIVV
ncbi:hypothetical protein DM01DRAFT_330786 [Hesseltinella vesiculosa]|uniref:Uncharacterized protein n=1 Tax=Hesseltinella vesiculosa TaxID=101127 RepID=A0A1X2G489_9FUNG|nr:hypothetical protein DM01DRAFT_330786 [Hesseltinella vesiculosa]